MTPKPQPSPAEPQPPAKRTGISNRATATEEQADRQAHPPIDPGPPPPQDAAGRIGDAEAATFDGAQTSHKAGSRSIGRNEEETSRKAGGAFGKEPKDHGQPGT